MSRQSVQEYAATAIELSNNSHAKQGSLLDGRINAVDAALAANGIASAQMMATLAQAVAMLDIADALNNIANAIKTKETPR